MAEPKGKTCPARRPFEPLYTTAEATAVMEHFVPCDYMEMVEVCDGITCVLQTLGIS